MPNQGESGHNAVTNEQIFLIAMGANLPWGADGPNVTLRHAVEMLTETGVSELRISRFFATPCFPAGAGPDYVNAAAALRFDGTAAALLERLHRIEAHFGRERVQRWGQRTLDLDLIAAGDQVLPDVATYQAWHDLAPQEQAKSAPDQLILPHPRIQDRAFVLVPLADVVPDWRHPVLGLTVRKMLDKLPAEDVAGVVPLSQ